MKTPFPRHGAGWLLALLALAGPRPVAAQNTPPGVITQAVVNIVVVDARGSEIPEVPPGMGMPQLIDPAVFRISRSGPTNFDMPVLYTVSGSAANGVDYHRLSGQLTIPAGAHAANLEVIVLDDTLVEGTESVLVTLEPIACIAIFPPPPECYLVGSHNRAAASILDNDSNHHQTNLPPVVRLTAPTNHARFPAPADITLAAETVDPDGYASTVEFFANNVKIGESTLVFVQPPPPGQPLHLDFQWLRVPAGSYALTARTRDDDGAGAVSAPVYIMVGTNNILPVVNIVARDAYASEGTNFLGTNNPAVFVISRTGPTNTALSVAYHIGGTASNGVDYALIGQSATIPIGRRSARVVIQPLPDQLAEPVESVILSLRPASAAGTVPAYVIGTPARAAATISDPGHVPPPCLRLPDHLFHFCLPRTNGFGHRIEVAANLADWQVVCTNVVVDGAVHFVDPDAPAHQNRFFRVSPAPAPVED